MQMSNLALRFLLTKSCQCYHQCNTSRAVIAPAIHSICKLYKEICRHKQIYWKRHFINVYNFISWRHCSINNGSGKPSNVTFNQYSVKWGLKKNTEKLRYYVYEKRKSQHLADIFINGKVVVRVELFTY